MTTFAYQDADGWICLTEDGTSTWLPSADGDTPAHVRLAAWLDEGGLIENGPPPPAPLTGEQLELFKSEAKREIDLAAELARQRFITPGAGQAMTYAQKAEEARSCLAATDPIPADYPLLAAEIGITAETLIGVAQVVAAANSQWLQIGAAIEAARLGTKAAITAAATIEEAQAAASGVVWPSP